MEQDITLEDVSVAEPVVRATASRSGHARRVFDVTATVRNRSKIATYHVTSAARYLTYEPTKAELLLETVDRFDGGAEAIPVRAREHHHVAVKPEETCTLVITVPCLLRVQVAPSTDPTGRKGLGEAFESVDLTRAKTIRVRLAYNVSPFYEAPSEAPSARRQRLREWAAVVEKSVALAIGSSASA
jgi:hypothetical protein